MKKINLALGIHNHQPIGNFESIFEEAYQKAYLPFLKVHEKHPEIKLAYHFTGILFEWILERHPEFLPELNKLINAGQVEMMTGAYYEPILITIPDDDKVGQIRKLTSFVRDKTGYDPQGIWLAERVWEPQLPSPIAEAGVRYSLIDDAHFKYAGLREKDLYGYYTTEDNGALLNIMPISEKLRYLIPFHPPEETVEFLRSIATDKGDRLIVFADDGEKFGVWPGTFVQCYENGWLDRFFALLSKNRDWINILTFSQAMAKLKPLGRVYLPTASYSEMMEWALPFRAIHEYEDFDEWLIAQKCPEDYKLFVRGGFWRNFLAKYEESNNLHKRMLLSSSRLKKLGDHKNKKSYQSALDALYAGQCNCPFWHGIFGGLYLPHLRSAIYEQLIKADVEMDRLEKSAAERKNGWITCRTLDFNADGFDEVVVETDRMNLFFAPKAGGSLFELDYKPKNINILDSMTRREEGYHRKLYRLSNRDDEKTDNVASIHEVVKSKEEGLEKYLHYDWYRRSAFVDHFFHPNTTIESMLRGDFGEQGDFVDHPYTCTTGSKNGHYNIKLERRGNVWIESDFVPVGMQKTFVVTPKSNVLTIEYKITNLSKKNIELWFGTEFIFALLAGDAPDRYYSIPGTELQDRKLASIGSIDDATHINLIDEWMGLDIGVKINKKATVWRFPVETISMSEAGFERVYQCSVVLPNWKIQLTSGKSWLVIFEQNITVI